MILLNDYSFIESAFYSLPKGREGIPVRQGKEPAPAGKVSCSVRDGIPTGREGSRRFKWPAYRSRSSCSIPTSSASAASVSACCRGRFAAR